MNFTIKKMMKLKSNLITGLVIACLLSGGVTIHAQGIYSSTDNTSTNNTPSSSSSSPSSSSSQGQGGGGFFRGDCDDPFGCEDGDGKGSDPDGDPDPLGEGILILSLLSGAYALVKRNTRNKHED